MWTLLISEGQKELSNLPLLLLQYTAILGILGLVLIGYRALDRIGQTLAHIDGHVRIGVRAGGVVDQHRRIDLATELGRGDVETDLAHRYADVRARALHVDLLRTRKRLDRLLVDLGGITQIRGVEVFFLCAHRLVLSWYEMSERTWGG